MIKLSIKLIRQKMARYLLLKALEMYEGSSEVMATMPEWTLVHRGARLHSAIADMYAELAIAVAGDVE